jgi:type VI secretion system protein VasG
MVMSWSILSLAVACVALGIALGVAGCAAWRAPRPRPGDREPGACSLRALVEKLSPAAKRSLESAAGLALAHSHHRVEVEHWLLRLAEDCESDVAQLFQFYEVLTGPLMRDLGDAVDRYPDGNEQVPVLAPELVRLLGLAWNAATEEFDSPQLRSGHVLYAALSDRRLAGRLRRVSPEFEKVDTGSLRDQFGELILATEDSQS